MTTKAWTRLKTSHRDFPYHTILIANCVWLSAFSANYEKLLFVHAVYNAALVAVTAAIILLSVLWIVLRNGRAAGVMATLIIIGVFYFGHIFDPIDGFSENAIPAGIFQAGWIAVFSFLLYRSYVKRDSLKNMTVLLNIATVIIALSTLLSVVPSMIRDGRVDDIAVVSATAFPTSRDSEAGSAEYPDIYFLIVDRYAGNRTLTGDFNYDNSGFLSALRARGFYVADRSRANYTTTGPSLASSLNLKHLNYLSETMGPNSRNWKPIYALLQDHEVGRFLKARGYRYVHLGSFWEPTSYNLHADENFDPIEALPWPQISLNEFEWRLVEKMLPTRLFDGLGSWKRRQHFIRVQEKFKKMAALARQDSPQFVFAHMLLPHTPFVFFDDGRYKSLDQVEAMTREKNYVDQVIYTNEKFLELIDLLQQKSPQPIIILQADEGPHPLRFRSDYPGFDWRNATDEELKHKFRIINAMFFPDRNYQSLYPDITPINTFPVIFNQFFDQDIALLPDTIRAYHSFSDLYSYRDVTEATE